jgi:hypothetical protein
MSNLKITPEEGRGKEAFELNEQIKLASKTVSAGFVVIAQSLWRIDSGHYFTELGHDSFNSYLHDSDFAFSASLGHALLKTYKQLVLRYQVQEVELARIGQVKSTILARYTENKNVSQEEVDALVYMAESASVPEFRAAVREKLTGVTQAQCHHHYIGFQRCSKCYRVKYPRRIIASSIEIHEKRNDSVSISFWLDGNLIAAFLWLKIDAITTMISQFMIANVTFNSKMNKKDVAEIRELLR